MNIKGQQSFFFYFFFFKYCWALLFFKEKAGRSNCLGGVRNFFYVVLLLQARRRRRHFPQSSLFLPTFSRVRYHPLLSFSRFSDGHRLLLCISFFSSSSSSSLLLLLLLRRLHAGPKVIDAGCLKREKKREPACLSYCDTVPPHPRLSKKSPWNVWYQVYKSDRERERVEKKRNKKKPIAPKKTWLLGI